MKKCISLLLILGLLCTLFPAAGVFADDNVYQWDGTANGWELKSGFGIANSTLDDFHKGEAIFQLTPNATGWLTTEKEYGHVTLSASIKFDGVRSDGGVAAMMFNYYNDNNNYMLMFDTKSVMLKKKVDSTAFTEIAAASAQENPALAATSYDNVTIDSNQGHITVKVTPAGGEEIALFDVTDTTRTEGKVGFFAWGAQHFYISDITIASDGAVVGHDYEFTKDESYADWTLSDNFKVMQKSATKMANVAVAPDKMMTYEVPNGGTPESTSAMYNKTLQDDFTYSFWWRMESYGNNQRAIAYFNYQDEANYYMLWTASSGYQKPVRIQLEKVENGMSEALASVTKWDDQDFLDNIYAFEISYKNGAISVKSAKNATALAEKKEIINVEDPTFTKGQIGFAGKSLALFYVGEIIIDGGEITEPDPPKPEEPSHDYEFTKDESYEDWTLSDNFKVMQKSATKMANVAVAPNKMITYEVPNGGTAENTSAMYNKTLQDDFTYSFWWRMESYGTAQRAIAYFNYQDEANYYRLWTASSGYQRPASIHLEKVSGGMGTELAVVTKWDDQDFLDNIFAFEISYKNGSISVKSAKNATANAEKKEIINVEDTTFTQGQIGFAGNMSLFYVGEIIIDQNGSQGPVDPPEEPSHDYEFAKDESYEDWTLSDNFKVMQKSATKMANVAVAPDKMITYEVPNGGTPENTSAMYNKTLQDDFTYSFWWRMESYGNNQRAIAYFNYQDEANYYMLWTASSGYQKPVRIQLEKVSGGMSTELASVTTWDDGQSFFDNIYAFEISYKNGAISVKSAKNATANAEKKEIINVEDASFTQGQIGFAGKSLALFYVGEIIIDQNGSQEPVDPPGPDDPDGKTQYKFDGSAYGWNLSNGAVVNAQQKSISNSWASTDTKCKAIYNGYYWQNEYTYSLTAYNEGNASGNAFWVYFNYKDTQNYYRLSIGGFNPSSPTPVPINLSKFTSGQQEVLADEQFQAVNRSYQVVIKQKDGKINVTVKSGNAECKLEDIEASNAAGFIGIAAWNTFIRATDITVVGDAIDAGLRMEASDVEDGAENIPVSGQSFTLDFNYGLDNSTLGADTVLLRVKGAAAPLSAEDYEINWQLTSPKRLTINLLKPLAYKTNYEIVVTDSVCNSEYGACSVSGPIVIGFKTIAPDFDVNAELKSGNTPVSDVSKLAGQTISWSTKITNSGAQAQNYIASVCIFNPDGQLLSGRYYKGALAAGGEDLATVAGSMVVPSEVKEGAKVVMFIWDGVETMNVLYESIEF